MVQGAATLRELQGPHRRWTLADLFIWVAILVGIGLRFIQLRTLSLWFDEGYTAWVVSLGPREIVRVIEVDTAPPLYYLLLKGWTAVFGHGEAGLRSMSAVFSSATLIVCYAIAKKVLRERWAVAGVTCLFALAVMPVAYAHEARFYSMMAFLAAASLYLILMLVEQSSIGLLALLALVWVASLYTNNIMAIYLAGLGAAWLLLPGATSIRQRFAGLVSVGAIASVAYAPWVRIVMRQMGAIQHNFWAKPPATSMLGTTISLLAGVNNHALPWLATTWIVVCIAALVVGLSVGLCRRSGWRLTLGLACVGLGPILFGFVFSRIRQPIFIERAFLPSTAILPILLVLPMVMLKSRWHRQMWAGIVALLILMSAGSLRGQRLGEHPEKWREASAYVEDRPAKARVVVFCANEGEMLFDYYERGRKYGPRADLTGVPSSFFDPTIDPPRTMRGVRTDADLDGLRKLVDGGSYDELVFMQSHPWFSDPEMRVLGFLRGKLRLSEERHFTQVDVYRFLPDR